MYPLFESIKLTDQQVFNIDLHIVRMQHAARLLWNQEPELKNLKTEILQSAHAGLQKCNVFYNRDSYKIETKPYQKRAINQLHFVHDDEVQYELKFTDRQCLLRHTHHLSDTDEVVIIKNNRLTDTSFSNIALWNGKVWHTPLHPIFPGIKRASLLKKNIIIERDILKDELKNYQKISLINAMLNLGELELGTGQLAF